jgi:hypothetical protein
MQESNTPVPPPIMFLTDSCEQLLNAVAERDNSRLLEVLANQREKAAAIGNRLDRNTQDRLGHSIEQALLLARLNRAHLLDSIKTCRRQLAILQAYQENCPEE